MFSQLSSLYISHRNWLEALEEAFALITCASPGEVVAITGPSRSGKTMLILKLIELLVGIQSIVQDGIMNCLVVEASNSGPNGTFSTKAWMIRLLDELKHPMFSCFEDHPEPLVALKRVARTTEHELRVIAVKAMQSRQVKYLFIDEAQHVQYAPGRMSSAQSILDSWKCFAKEANVVLVIVGAYPVLEVILNCPHLVGRKHQIHLPRYKNHQDDLKHFSEILVSYQNILGSHIEKDLLLKNLRFVYESTLGCIGLLKAWLTRAVVIAETRESKITLPILKKTKFSLRDLKSIEREILDGESMFDSIEFRPVLKSTPSTKARSHKPFQAKPKRRGPGNRNGGDS